MGYKIGLQEGYCTEDLASLADGLYNVVVRDAVGCRETATFEIVQSGTAIEVILNSTTDASCFGVTDGVVDVEVNGELPVKITGEGPAFAVISEPKNHSHPMFGTGSTNGFTVNGMQGKELTLIRGITYAFSVFTPGHPFFISTSSTGGPGSLGSEVTVGVINSMTTNGTLFFTPDESHPSLLYYQCGAHNNMGYIINIIDHPGDGDLQNCMSGNYSLFYTDNTGCTTPFPLNFFIAEPDAVVFYYDEDGDLFGDTGESALACTAPPGFVADSGDCDVTDPSVNPMAGEKCNGIDDNCDGLTDEVCQSTLNVRIYLEGLYMGSGNMSSPLFNTGASSDPSVSDSVIIALHENNSPFSELFSDTVLVSTSGECMVAFPAALEGSDVYISVRSRNNLETWSRTPVTLSTLTNYDFTVSSGARPFLINK